MFICGKGVFFLLKLINQKLNPIAAPFVEFKGFENVYISQPTIFICNHISIEDFSLLEESLPKHIHIFIHESEVKQNAHTLRKRMVSTYRHFNEKIIQEMETILSNNVPIFLFPEGKVSSSDMIMPIQKELAPLFRYPNLLVYPMHINGAPYIKSCPFRNDVLKTVSHITVTLGRPFSLSNRKVFSSDSYILNEIYQALHHQKYESLAKENVNLYNELVATVKNSENPNAEIKDEFNSLSYKKFLISVNVLGTRFEKLFEEEDRVGTLLPTSLGYALTLFSLFKAGKTPALLNFTMGSQTLLDCCETANLTSILTSKEFVRKANLEEVIQILSKEYRIYYLEDIKSQLTSSEKIIGLADSKRYKRIKYHNSEIVLFTSGSENKPKGVILTHDNIYNNIQQLISTLHLKPNDKFMNVLPMFHSFGMTVGCILPILFGVHVFLYPSPISYKTIPQVIYEENSTLLFGTSTFFQHYGNFAEKHYFQKLRYVIAGAEKLKEEVKQTWSSKFGIRIIEGYGVTEASPVLSLNRPTTHEDGSVGQILPGMEYQIEPVEGIVNGGNLLVKGPNIMRGYLLYEKGFVPHTGWYRTGDVVEINETEHIFIKARLKRFAKIGGEMVSLNTVEQMAIDCFGDTQYASVSIPDKRKGERIILFTTNEDIKERALKKFIKEQKQSNLLVPYKIEYIEEIPILGTGKTDYVSLQVIANEKFSKK